MIIIIMIYIYIICIYPCEKYSSCEFAVPRRGLTDELERQWAEQEAQVGSPQVMGFSTAKLVGKGC